MLSQKAQVGVDALKISPAATVVGTHILGINWPDVAYILTAIYTVIMIVQHVKQMITKRAEKKKEAE